MKIVKKIRAGEEPRLPAWIAAEIRPIFTFTGTGSALWAGSAVLARLGWDALGERFTGWERLGAIAAGGYVLVYVSMQSPRGAAFAGCGMAVAWCVAAWWVAPPVLDAPAPAPEVMTARDGFVLWLADLMDGQPGIHLRDLYPAMREMPGHEDRDNAELRGALKTLGIPVRRSLRIGKQAGRSGVALADLEPLPSPPGERGVESDGEAGQDVDSTGGERPGERLEST